MPPRGLRPADVAALRRADSVQISLRLRSVVTTNGVAWMRASHPHPNGVLPRKDADFNLLSDREVVEAIAARSPLHSFDGWSYLARSLASLVAGDAHTAKHLAYYAELRAALSILASEGVGVFNSQNRVVDEFGALHALEARGTHDMCWATLDSWAALPGAAAAITQNLKFNGMPFSDILSSFFPGASTAALASQIVKEWGFDLSLAYSDRDERNASSYSPSALIATTQDPNVDIAFVRTFWDAFEPGSWILEKHMVRKLLELQGQLAGTPDLSTKYREYDTLDSRFTDYVTMNFLMRTEEPLDHDILAHSANQTHPAKPVSMACRAALLLKIALSFVDRNFSNAQIDPGVQLQPWWSKFGSDLGFWPSQSPPPEMSDLWYDVRDALTAISLDAKSDRYSWFQDLSKPFHRIFEAERIALWSVFR